MAASVFGSVKLFGQTFEKVRFKLQKGSNAGNSKRSVGDSADYFEETNSQFCSPITKHDALENVLATTDIGLLPIERESSCLQDVLERNGLARTLADLNEKKKVSSESQPVSGLANQNEPKTETSATGCLVDLNDDISLPDSTSNLNLPPLPIRSFSTQTPGPGSSESAYQRSKSADAFTQPPSSNQQDLLDGIYHQDMSQNGFAHFTEFGNSDKDSKSTLVPTPILTSKAESNNNNDPFASIFDDFQSQPAQQAQPKKLTLGDLAGNNVLAANPLPMPVIQLPPLNDTLSTGKLSYNRDAPQLNTPTTTTTTTQSPTQQSCAFSSTTAFHFQTQQSQSTSSDDAFSRLDMLGDILEDLGYSRQSSTGSKTMRDMRKDLLTKEMDSDPEAVKVRLWAEGKEGNIRALLSTLEQILWNDDTLSKWEPIPIHQLVKIHQVKRAYKKAAVVVHPDKLIGTPYERISRLVFVELNEANSEFQKEIEQSCQ